MRSALVGAVLLVLGAVAVLTGILPSSEAVELGERVWPILLFVIAITIVTELAAEAGLFSWVANRLARWGGSRAWVLWLFVVALAVVSTVFLSLDTTAVLLTPIVIVLARHAGLSPLPFALTTVWLANTGSLLLPVSNLTNLLAQHELDGVGPLEFAALMAGSALVGVIVPTALIFVIYRRDLLRRYEVEQPSAAADPVLFGISAVTVGLLLPLLVSGIEVWIPATAGAIVLGAAFLVRRREVLRFGLVPWQLMLLASGLFLVVETGHALGLSDALGSFVAGGDGVGGLLAIAGVGAGGANLLNNLPAYLALEPIAGSPERLAALLVGVNAGPLITPWASLATLLWHERVSSMGVTISWWRYAALGLIVVPLTVVPAVLLLAV
ncbi:SLC13 family permease [Amnibacterium flavum]|uniref:Arsenic transporter n=1 Tax=Amnibacterium flavum TaxID=2173173 RepID=A0A2V1HV83_9MICO|nr:SLC13 family permease [Amnibacterium flavum]PVZ94237.1 arsenic transporter [Amnibacterium flavum]